MSSNEGNLNGNFYKIEIYGVNFNLLKRYTEIEKVGSGKHGYVIKTYDKIEKCNVAIKKVTRPFISLKTAQCIYRKFSILNIHTHPNIIKLLNVYTPHPNLSLFNEIYLVTEFGGISLSEVIYKQKNKMSHDQISFLLYQALCAVKYLHQMGVIHKNLSPESFMVNHDCVLKLINFGLPVHKNLDISTCTKPKPYISSELLFGMSYNSKVDIWSLGLIFTELFITYSMEKPMSIFNLFSGIDHNEQWLKIIQFLGTPSIEFISRTGICQKWIMSFPTIKSRSWGEILSDNCFPNKESSRFFNASMAREILSKMLVIDPEERYSVEETLQNIYVNCWFREEEANLKPIQKYDHSVELNKNFDEKEWRQLFFDQLKDYEQSHNVYDDPKEIK